MTGVCVLFAIVYRIFGHGIYSLHIRFLFTLPLFYFLVFRVIYRTKANVYMPALIAFRGIMVSELARNALIGIFEVYGTTYSKVKYLLYVTFFLAFLTVVLALTGVIVEIKKRKTK